MVHHYFLKNLGKETKIGHCPVIFHIIITESGFFNRAKTRAELKSEWKEPSKSNKVIIDVIDVIRMSI